MQFKKQVLLFLVISLYTSPLLFSQNEEDELKPPTNIELGFQWNSLITSFDEVKNLRSSGIGFDFIYWRDIPLEEKTFETDYFDRLDHKDQANKIFSYPLVGIYGNTVLGLHSAVGIPIAVGATTDLSLYETRDTYLSFRPRIGLAYLTRKYDTNTNPENLLIGSDFNLNVQLGLYYTLQKWNQIMKVGTNLSHFSNGSITRPNWGLNLWSTSLIYQFGPRLYEANKFYKTEYERLHKEHGYWFSPYVQGGVFLKQVVMNQSRFVGSHLVAGASQEVNGFLKINAQFHWIKDPSIESELANRGITNYKNDRLAISAGLKAEFHRLTLTSNLGYYFYKPEEVLDKPFFQHYQLDYILSRHTYIYLGGIAHLNESDFMELGVGFRI